MSCVSVMKSLCLSETKATFFYRETYSNTFLILRIFLVVVVLGGGRGTNFQVILYEYQLNSERFSFALLQTSLSNVEHRINTMLQYQHHSRSKESRDYNLLLDNNLYVIRWSVLQIICIVATSVLQVYFVRQLFEIKKNRPRA